MYFSISLLFLPFVSLQVLNDGKMVYNEDEIKCLVCRQYIKEIEDEVTKVPSAKKMPQDFRIDGDGNIGKPNIEYRRSETFLTDIMENVCEKMDNAVKVKHKVTGELMLFTLTVNGNQVNPLINDIELLDDSGVGRNPMLYCEQIMDKYDEVILESFKAGKQNLDETFCSTTNYCPNHGKTKEEL